MMSYRNHDNVISCNMMKPLFLVRYVLLIFFCFQVRGNSQFPGSHPVSLNRSNSIFSSSVRISNTSDCIPDYQCVCYMLLVKHLRVSICLPYLSSSWVSFFDKLGKSVCCNMRVCPGSASDLVNCSGI